MSSSPDVVGRDLPHESAIGHVSGAARYIDDLPLPDNAAHVACGFAPVACGKLVSLDLSAVRAAPGVLDVITASDVPGGVEVGPGVPRRFAAGGTIGAISRSGVVCSGGRIIPRSATGGPTGHLGD